MVDADNDPQHNFQTAETLDRAGDFERALFHYMRASSLSPENPLFHIHYGHALFRSGRWKEGWRETSWYWKPQGLAVYSPWGLHTPIPLLREGDGVEGKSILVTGWGGLGDWVMFIQLAQQLTRRGAAAVTLHLNHNLSFFGRNRWGFPIISATTVGEFYSAMEQFDAWVPNGYLPAVLDLEPADIQGTEAYFAADAERRSHWRDVLSSTGPTRRKIGLAWSGDPGNLYECNRSIATQDLLGLLGKTSGIDWYVVQKNDRNAELEALRLPFVFDHSNAFVDLDETAALMSELDLIISVDSLPAHLAASLGKPVWLLLSAAGDWRWGLEGHATPWYGSMRIHRQKAPGDWTDVLERVAAELMAL